MRARRVVPAFAIRYVAAVAVAFASASIAYADAVSELDDAAARMQYGFYTADSRSINDALSALQRLELPQTWRGMKEYYTAYGHWKLAELYTAEANGGLKEARARVSSAASACERAAESATRLDARLAEAYALEAICAAMSSRIPQVLSFGRCERRRSLRTAVELDPGNPRIKLIQAQCMIDMDVAASSALLEALRDTVRAFEAASPSKPGRPDWGQAEALLLLGRLQLARGDALGARESIERALVIAPDYLAAQEQLSQTAARTR